MFPLNITRWTLWATIALYFAITSVAYAANSQQSLNAKLIQDVASGSLQKVKQDLAHGADVNAKDSFGATPLFNAVNQAPTPSDKASLPVYSRTMEGKYAAIVNLLVEHGADVNAMNNLHDTVLINAVRGDKAGMVSVLITHGANVNVDVEDEPSHLTPHTPLSIAARFGYASIVNMLLAHGADVNAWDGLALTKAATYGQVSAIRVLLSHGANPKLGSDDNALDEAASHGFTSIVKLLLAHGVNVNARDKVRNTALIWAVQDKSDDYVDVVRVLLAHGADVNVKNIAGDTPMSLAKDHPDIINLLLANSGGEKLVCEGADGASVGVDIVPESKTVALFNGTRNWDYPDQVTIKSFTDDQIEFTTPDKAYNCDASGHCSLAPPGAYSDVFINRDTGQMEIDAYMGGRLTRSQWTCAKAKQKF